MTVIVTVQKPSFELISLSFTPNDNVPVWQAVTVLEEPTKNGSPLSILPTRLNCGAAGTGKISCEAPCQPPPFKAPSGV